MLEVVRQDLGQATLFHFKRVVGIDEIDVRMDLEIQCEEDQRGLRAIRIRRIQYHLHFRRS